MHNNYHFLLRLSEALKEKITGVSVSDLFSQDRDDAVIIFENGFIIRCHFTRRFSCLSFPESYNRAKRNSATVLPEIIGQKVADLIQTKNDRSFRLKLTNGFDLLFKLHGNNSNLILFKDQQVCGLFKNSLSNDRTIKLAELDRDLKQSQDDYETGEVKSLFPTFGKVVTSYLEQQGFSTMNVTAQWELILNTRQKLTTNDIHISLYQEQTILTLVPLGNTRYTFADPIDAITRFFQLRIAELAFYEELSKAKSILTDKIRKTRSYITKTNAQLKKLKEHDNYQVLGDNIMANLHIIPKGSSSINLIDVYSGNKISIRLNPKLSPQENAQRFYRKQKNQHIEIDKISGLLNSRQSEHIGYENLLKEVEAAANLSELRDIIKKNKILQSGSKRTEIRLPFWEKEYEGFRILIGKNAKSNDELLRSYTWKEDLWLHARDVPGSHVIVKYQPNRPFPKTVVERAAQLAAFFSKRKTEGLSPVIYTPRKYVRKRKGDPAGLVVVEKEEVLLVAPSD